MNGFLTNLVPGPRALVWDWLWFGVPAAAQQQTGSKQQSSPSAQARRRRPRPSRARAKEKFSHEKKAKEMYAGAVPHLVQQPKGHLHARLCLPLQKTLTEVLVIVAPRNLAGREEKRNREGMG